jgi:peroxiredoxin
LLNKYAKSFPPYTEVVYTHIALKYYASQKPSWIETENLNKIIENAKRLQPLLIGKKAPNLSFRSLNGTAINLHEFSARNTILFFYRTDSKLCLQAIPALKKLEEKFAGKGVKIFTVCINYSATKTADANLVDGTQLTSWIISQGMGQFFNTYDGSGSNQARTTYNISNLPQVYILDENKIIQSKNLSTDSIEKVLAALGL